MNQVIQAGQPFTDKEFPPCQASLFDEHDHPSKAEKFKNYIWKRASDFYKHPEVFQQGVHPNDINQGNLGNCYYLAVLSAMAEYETRVKARFYTQKVNKAGIYLMSFFVNGVEKPVIVDDWFPVNHHTKKPVFSSSKDEELWVMLMEKAWAKL